MKLKFFIVSDIHGFFTIFIKKLKEAGFEPNNPNHILVVLGDCWDRGYEPQEVMDYLMSLTNCILIKGNHEALMEQMIERGHALRNDYHNGTAETAAILIENYCAENHVTAFYFDTLKPIIRDFYGKMIPYLETEHYIFVHSWIPYSQIPKMSGVIKTYDPNWRNADKFHWEEEAMWQNPFKMAKDGLNQTGKIIVHGHWHNSTYWAEKENTPEFDRKLSKFDIAYHDNCIGLDACTVFSNQINVLVLEDNLI